MLGAIRPIRAGLYQLRGRVVKIWDTFTQNVARRMPQANGLVLTLVSANSGWVVPWFCQQSVHEPRLANIFVYSSEGACNP